MYTGGDTDTIHFLGMRFVDSSHKNTVAKVLPGRGKIFKHWQVRGYTRVGDHCFSVAYIFQTLTVDKKDCFDTHSVHSHV